MNLNQLASRRVASLIQEAESLRIAVSRSDSGVTLIDCGIDAAGGLEAGRWMAEICMADLGQVNLVKGQPGPWPGPQVAVRTDHPVAACMAAQYAGWQISKGQFFAMGSGPMRAAAGREELFDSIGYREKADQATGILESSRLPPPEVCVDIAAACGLRPDKLSLLVAPTSSLAGTIQIVSRTVETALHKLHELNFDLSCVQCGFGVAPLPPVASDDITGIGRTNDAVLYGGRVTLWVRNTDSAIQQVGPRVPSSASGDYGEPFSKIFQRYNQDFYAIDPHLFSPAEVTLINLNSGRSFHYGATRPDVLKQSFEES